MRVTHTGENKWLTRIGLMISTPVIVMVGAVTVLMLSTPVMLAITVIAFANALLWAATVVTRQAPAKAKAGKEAPMCESADMMATLEPELMEREFMVSDSGEREAVEMVEALTDFPRMPVNATITRVVGPCPLGMMPGNTWKIGPDGKLSRPMCRPGATSLSELLRMSDGDAMNRSTCCECLIAGREVTFTVREPERELANTPG
ncbi:MAG: hypothetical protein HQ475_13915 [SAR202 cluster bacterium]|nr:hypothetical protein [SAR202 cluster bacterium]